MPKSKSLSVAISFFELCLERDPDDRQVERWKIERAMKIVQKMQRGVAVRDDEVRFAMNIAAMLAHFEYLNRDV